MPSEQRPLRADAERNRQAIISAASTILSEEGTATTLEHIASVAGVGVGTIYRRFPTIDDLVAVVLEEKMTRYADRTEAAAEQASTEPWEAFRDYVHFFLSEQAADLGFSDVILFGTNGSGTTQFRSEIQRAFDASVILVNRAKAAGAIRADFHHSDLLLLHHANAGLLRGTQSTAPNAWKRLGDYMLQAFRLSGPEPLTPAPDAWH